MRSTGRSTGPCSSWTVLWSETRCYDTKRSRTRSRGTGRGGRVRGQNQRKMKPPGRCRKGWTQMRCTTRSSAPSAPLRWLCSIRTRSITSSIYWPATAETHWQICLIPHVPPEENEFRCGLSEPMNECIKQVTWSSASFTWCRVKQVCLLGY